MHNEKYCKILLLLAVIVSLILLYIDSTNKVWFYSRAQVTKLHLTSVQNITDYSDTGESKDSFILDTSREGQRSPVTKASHYLRFTENIYLKESYENWHTIPYLFNNSTLVYEKILFKIMDKPSQAAGLIKKVAWVDVRSRLMDTPCIRVFILLKKEFVNVFEKKDVAISQMFTLGLNFKNQNVTLKNCVYKKFPMAFKKLNKERILQTELFFPLQEIFQRYSKDQLSTTAILSLVGTQQRFEIQLKQIQPEQSHNKVEDFFICANMRYGNMSEEDEDFFMEWVEFNRLLGVTEIHISNGTWQVSPRMKNILDIYSEMGLVYVEDIEYPFYIENNRECSNCEFEIKELLNQISVHTCYFENLYRYKYMIVLDLDELIIPTEADSYKELIWSPVNRELTKASYSAYLCHWQIFGLFLNETTLRENVMSTDENSTSELITMRYRDYIPPHLVKQGKSFVNTQICALPSSHACVKPHRVLSNRHCYTYHYRKTNHVKNLSQKTKPKTDYSTLRFQRKLSKRYENIKKIIFQ